MPIEWDLKKRIVIRQLGETATKNEIKQLFQEIGVINKLWVARDPPGFAFLEYKRRCDAKTAVRLLDGKRCCGCYIKVDLSLNDGETHGGKRSSRKQYASIDDDDNYDADRRDHSGRRSHYGNASSSTSNSRLRHNSRRLSRNEQSNTAENSRLRHDSRIPSRDQQSHTNTENRRNRSRSVERQRLDCSICFHNLLKRDPTITPCMHVFCSACIRKTLQIQKRCPLCQAVTLDSQLKPIYLNS